MDDVKGPEQIVIRMKDGLGQDRDYMRRNFQIVQHLISGDEEVDPLENPKKWRAWKMPNRDFTLAIVDSRLWRSSQDTAIWDDEGWGIFENCMIVRIQRGVCWAKNSSRGFNSSFEQIRHASFA